MLTHPEFLEMVASETKPTFLSTGMCEWEQLNRKSPFSANTIVPSP